MPCRLYYRADTLSSWIYLDFSQQADTRRYVDLFHKSKFEMRLLTEAPFPFHQYQEVAPPENARRL